MEDIEKLVRDEINDSSTHVIFYLSYLFINSLYNKNHRIPKKRSK